MSNWSPSGLDTSAADKSGSVTLATSRPPSSLHSVPADRASSRVVSLHDHMDRSASSDSTALSFKVLPGSSLNQSRGREPLPNSSEDAGQYSVSVDCSLLYCIWA